MKKRILIISIIIVVVAALIIFVPTLVKYQKYKSLIANIEFSEVDISSVKDGTYNGEYDAILISAKVSVKIQDGKITNIEILDYYHDHGKGAEVIIERVILEQVVDVNAIAGVTNSCQVIKKAIDNALVNAINSNE